jgi:signal transduction histidine kinase
MAALMLLIVCGIDDTLFMNNASEIGYLIILFLQPFVISGRLSEAFKNEKKISQKLLSLNKLKDEFLANTSHELRTPLNGILSIAESMLRGKDGELNDSQRSNLTLITISSRRLTNLVNDILDYSKLKNGDILLNVQPVHIEGLIYTIVSIFRKLNTLENIEILFEVPDNLPPALADESRLTQILYNLMDNAVKFTDSGYVKVTVKKSGNMLEFCVADTGQGIPEEMLETIFKSFEQVDTSLTRRYGGTGLGLPIAKHFAELMGGKIWVTSKLGVGSVFTFTIPIAAESSGALNAAKKSNSEAAAMAALNKMDENINLPEKAPKILLVDDDAINLQATSSILRIGGFRVVTAYSGLSALSLLDKALDFSLVILDVMMPEMSGFELCRKIRKLKTCFELPILMLTARTAVNDIVMGFEAGANDYLSKPFEPEELLARVKMLTGLKESVDTARSAETAFLQAQIKPHFLFNTLNAISSFCDTDPEQAQRLIDDFSNYLRYCFDFKNLESFCSLESELSLVKSYVSIQKSRFGNQLNVEFDIDGMVYVRIPQFSIQPLVENAITHGLRKKGGKGTVVVSVKKYSESIRISVEDDGQGIEPEKLRTLLEKESGRGIGLWNIDSRLKALYGQGLKIISTLGKGTTVFFDIPSKGDQK